MPQHGSAVAVVPPDDPIWGAKPPRPRLAAVDGEPVREPFALRRWAWREDKEIPPRPWLYGTLLLRGFVSVLVAPGGTGKTSLALAIGLSLASGRKLLQQHVFSRVNVSAVVLEDPQDELDRRLRALISRHQIDREEIEGRFWCNSSDDGELSMARLDYDGFTIVHPDEQAVIDGILANNIGLLIVDPYAESHELEENSNPHQVRAMKAWRRVARATNCAVLLVHHVRKGAVTDIDAARGAKALTDGARCGMLLTPMGVDEGKAFRIPERQRYRYVRLDDAKANMAPRAECATWYHLDSIGLANGTQDYPAGDHVGAIVAWNPPGVFDGMSMATVVRILDTLDADMENGERYTLSRSGKDQSRWAGHVVMAETGRDEDGAKAVLKLWLDSGLVSVGEYDSPEQRKPRACIRVDGEKLADMRCAASAA